MTKTLCLAILIFGVSCKPRLDSSLNNSGIKDDAKKYQFIAQHLNGSGEQESHVCTSTIINLDPILILSAAHCWVNDVRAIESAMLGKPFVSSENAHFKLAGSSQLFFPESLYVMKEVFPAGIKYDTEDGQKFVNMDYFNSGFDIAIVKLKPTSDQSLVALKAAMISFDDNIVGPVTVLGWGLHYTGNTIQEQGMSVADFNFGEFHSGRNQIAHQDKYFRYIKGRTNNSVPVGDNNEVLTGPGDSGGPLLDVRGDIVGVVAHSADPKRIIESTVNGVKFVTLKNETIEISFGDDAPEKPSSKESVGWSAYTNVSRLEIKQFIENIISKSKRQ